MKEKVALDFVAVDVETANLDQRNICQIGLAVVEGGQVAERWSSLVNPEARFHRRNIGIHGIRNETVQDAPSLPELIGELDRRLADQIVVSYGVFDRYSLTLAVQRYGLGLHRFDWLNPYRWIDCLQVAKRAWPETYADRGCKLSDVSRDLGIEFKHHDAAEDADATARILLAACAATGLDIERWLERLGTEPEKEASPQRGGQGWTQGEQSVSGDSRASRELAQRLRDSGLAADALAGETVVFTGSLELDKPDAEALAEECGASVKRNVTKQTTLLVVGVRDEELAAEHGKKSGKQKRAEGLISRGQAIRIRSDGEFMNLVTGDPSGLRVAECRALAARNRPTAATAEPDDAVVS